MSSLSSMQVVGEELEKGLIYTITLQKVQRNNDLSLMKEDSCMVRTVKAGPWEKLVDHLVPAFQESDHMFVNIFLGTYRVFTTTKQVLDRLFQRYGRKICGSTRHGGCLEMKKTLSSLLGTWMDQYPEDFLQPPGSPCLKLLVAYTQVHLPGSALEHHAIVLLSQMRHPEPIEADPNAPLPAPELLRPPVRHLVPVPPPTADTGAGPEPPPLPLLPLPPMEVAPMTTQQAEPAPFTDVAAAARLEEVSSSSLSPVPELEAVPPLPPVTATQSAPVVILELQPNSPSATTGLKLEASLATPPEPPPELKSAAGWAIPPEPSCPWPETSDNGLSKVKAHLLAFPPELVAEQLTCMDAELFKKLLPYHCLGCIWSERNKKCKEHMAPTVCAIITQFNSVTNCVITTCLGDRNMKAPDRARVVEHWIEVARECKILNNFSSFCAILSALKIHSIHHLKKTWEEVSRDSFHLFQRLYEIFLNENNYMESNELIIKGIPKFATLERSHKRAQKQQQQERGVIQGIVPCLGTFLTQFLMVDYAMQEYLDGRMVNFDKRRKEYQMVAELQQLQVGCCYDSLVPNEQFGAWFGALEQLSEIDSYQLSCDLEPPSQLASKIFMDKHHPEDIKSWSEDSQAPDTASSGSSTPHSSVQLQCGPDFSSGDAADSPHIHVAGTSNSNVKIHLDHVPEFQDGQDMNGAAHLFSCQPSPSPSLSCANLGLSKFTKRSRIVDTYNTSRASWGFSSSPGVPRASRPSADLAVTQLEQSTSTSSQKSSIVTSASRGMSSSTSSIKHKSTQTNHKHPDFSSGDAVDSPHIHVASSSSSKVKFHLDHVPESQDGQETNVTAHLFSCQPSPSHSLSCASLALSKSRKEANIVDTYSTFRASWSFSSSAGLPRASRPSADLAVTHLEQTTSVSSPTSSNVTSVSRGTSSSTSSIKRKATRPSHKRRDTRPRHKRHMGDCCIIRVSLLEDNDNKYQNILVTDQERAPAVIRKALEEHNLVEDKPEDYMLVQIISEDRMLQIPDNANVYYAMHPSPKYHFLLMKWNTPMDDNVKNRAISVLLGKKQKRPNFLKWKLSLAPLARQPQGPPSQACLAK